MFEIQFGEIEESVKVTLGKKVAGRIRSVWHGGVKHWQYFPTQQKNGGRLYHSLEACKESLKKGGA